MEDRLFMLDAAPSTMEGEQLETVSEPELDEVVMEIGVSAPLMSLVMESGADQREAHAELDPEVLDPMIFQGLLAP